MLGTTIAEDNDASLVFPIFVADEYQDDTLQSVLVQVVPMRTVQHGQEGSQLQGFSQQGEPDSQEQQTEQDTLAHQTEQAMQYTQELQAEQVTQAQQEPAQQAQQAQQGYNCPVERCGYRVTCHTQVVHYRNNAMVESNGNPVSTLQSCNLVAHMEEEHEFDGKSKNRTCPLGCLMRKKDKYLHFIHCHCKIEHYTDGVHHGPKSNLVAQRTRCLKKASEGGERCRCLDTENAPQEPVVTIPREPSTKKRRKEKRRGPSQDDKDYGPSKKRKTDICTEKNEDESDDDESDEESEQAKRPCSKKK
jgi:hypothetical protein